MDLAAFSERFKNDDDCLHQLIRYKWPDGFSCPRCQHRAAYVINTRRLPLYECKACRKQTSPIVGTIFEGSRTPLLIWFQAIYLNSQLKSINALQLSQIIGVTYKTAWLMYHKIRKAMSLSDADHQLSGVISISEAVYAPRLMPSTDWHEQEQPLFIASEKDERSGERIRIKFAHCSKDNLRNRYDMPSAKPFIKEAFCPKVASFAYVTRRRGYDVNYKLLQICNEACSWIAWTFRGIGPKYLQVYLDQFAYRWNRTRRKQPFFLNLLQDCVRKPVITYPDLIGKPISARRSSKRVRPSTSVEVVAS